MKSKIQFSKGNRKLSNEILIWNLPRLITCPGAGACKDWCYETKIERMYKNVLPFRLKNYDQSFEDDFVAQACLELTKHKEKYVRVHESGDFYSQLYLDKWYTIASCIKSKKFYAYTKSLHLDLWATKPDNFIILQSSGGKFDLRIDMNHPTFRAIKKGDLMLPKEKICGFSGVNVGGCGTTKCNSCMEDPNAHIVTWIHK